MGWIEACTSANIFPPISLSYFAVLRAALPGDVGGNQRRQLREARHPIRMMSARYGEHLLLARLRRCERGKASRLCPSHSDVYLFGYGERAIDLDAEIPDVLSIVVCPSSNCTAQGFGAKLDECCLGWAQRMRGKKGVQSDARDPLRHEASILPGRDRVVATATAGKQGIAPAARRQQCRASPDCGSPQPLMTFSSPDEQREQAGEKEPAKHERRRILPDEVWPTETKPNDGERC
jgi:hypothetical protein